MACLVFPAFGQEEAESVEEADAAPEVIEEPAETGDVLVLKNGDRISGFQIIRATHRHYILEGMYDPETDESLEIKVSRGQVVEVIRDDIEPGDLHAAAMQKALLRQRTTVQGARLSDTLYGLLERVIGEPPINTEGMNLTQVLEEVNKRVDGALKIGAAVLTPPRKWTGTIEPDTTLAMFLDNQIAPNYPGLAVVFEEDLVRIRPQGPAAAGDAPPAAAGPGEGAPPAAGPGGRGGAPAGGLGGGRGGTPPVAGPPPSGTEG